MKPIHVYYTLATKHEWQFIFSDQLVKMANVGLIPHITQFNLGINLMSPDVTEIPTVEGLNVNILYNTDDNPYERVVYQHIMLDATNSVEPYNVLYLHSKGVNGNRFAKSWRDYMEYFCIEQWQTCVNGLGIDYDTCGVNLHPPQEDVRESSHYSGNFWWATSDYIKTLDPNTYQRYIQKHGRYAEEQFTCSNADARHKSWHHTSINFYDEEYPSHKYR